MSTTSLSQTATGSLQKGPEFPPALLRTATPDHKASRAAIEKAKVVNIWAYPIQGSEMIPETSSAYRYHIFKKSSWKIPATHYNIFFGIIDGKGKVILTDLSPFSVYFPTSGNSISSLKNTLQNATEHKPFVAKATFYPDKEGGRLIIEDYRKEPTGKRCPIL